MTINKKLFLLLIIFSACNPDLSDDPIPFVPFADFLVNINSHPTLLSDGGYIYISSSNAGVRGVILYRKNSDTFLAFEQNCSYHPNEACSTVNVDATTLFMIDACCGSTFNFEGNPTKGPAWRPLRQYQTSVSGSTLTITDAIL